MTETEKNRRSRALAAGLISELSEPGLSHLDITQIRARYALLWAELDEQPTVLDLQPFEKVFVVGYPDPIETRALVDANTKAVKANSQLIEAKRDG